MPGLFRKQIVVKIRAAWTRTAHIDLYRTAEAERVFGYTFFKAVGVKRR